MNDGQIKVITDIGKERERQDKQWGGPAHDDEHSPLDWSEFIKKHLKRYRCDEDAYVQRIHMVRVAALAVAAIESLDRQRAEAEEREKYKDMDL